jgi:hypothetical protein
MTDHRAAAPVPEDILRREGLPISAGRGLFEASTYTCKHCQKVVFVVSRDKEIPFCRGCGRYICSECAAIKAITKQCKTFDQVLDEALIAATVQQSTGG